MLSPREKRLQADFEEMRQLVRDSSILQVDSRGQPPQLYRVRFHGWGLRLGSGGQIEPANEHEATIELGAGYPRMMPTIIWRTSIFHPNISPHGVVCLGGFATHWVPSVTLGRLCHMLWDMVRYRNFDPESPYNREAAVWVKSQAGMQLPIDPRPLRDRVAMGDLPATRRSPWLVEEAVQPAAAEIVFL